MGSSTNSSRLMWAACGLGAVYAVVTLTAKPSFALTAFGDIAQLILAALVTVAFALPIRHSRGRIRWFWALMTTGVFSWFISQAMWTYFELVKKIEVVDPSIQDIILFLHLIPMMAALCALPHKTRKMPPVIPYALTMVGVWWAYLYSYVVIPWQYVTPDLERYGTDFNALYTIEDLAFMLVLCVLAVRSSGPWRTLYRRLLLGSMGYMISAFLINNAITNRSYYTGSLFDLPLIFSILCICWSATSACTPAVMDEEEGDEGTRLGAEWLNRLAFIGLLSVPFMAAHALEFSGDPDPVRKFRIGVSAIAMVLMATLLFKIQRVLSGQLEQTLKRVKESNEELERARQALQHQAMHDSMTGLMNRSAITETLERELSRATRSETRVAVLLIDLDHFKEINDRFGHHAGDVAIIAAATRFQDSIRLHDSVGRYGGEEFLAIVPESEYTVALEIAERVRTQLSATPVLWQANEITLTATIGVALSREGDNAQSLLRRADVALYAGKTISRDTVQVADEDIFAA